MSENLDTNTETVVEKISVEDIDNLLGMPGSESVMIPTEEQKPNFFSSNDVDVSFVDNNETTEETIEEKTEDDNKVD